MSPLTREYYVTRDFSLVPVLEKVRSIGREVEIKRMERLNKPPTSASSIAKAICGDDHPTNVTYTIEEEMRKIFNGTSQSKELRYGEFSGTPDIITVEGDIIELKSTSRSKPPDVIMCKGAVQSAIYGALKVLSDPNNNRFPKIYLWIGYYERDAEGLTATLKKIEMYSVNIKMEGFGVASNVVTPCKAKRIIQSLRQYLLTQSGLNALVLPR